VQYSTDKNKNFKEGYFAGFWGIGPKNAVKNAVNLIINHFFMIDYYQDLS